MGRRRKPENGMAVKTQDSERTLMFDPSTHRVGCVLMQAAFGFGENNWLVGLFNTEAWITGEGVEKLKPYKATVAQWKMAAEKCNKVHGKRHGT